MPDPLEIKPVLDYVAENQPLVFRATWRLGMNELGRWDSPFPATVWVDKIAHVWGNFSGGAELVWEGSNDGERWLRLEHLRSGCEDLLVLGVTPAFLRPRVVFGDAETDFRVVLVGRKA